MEYGKEEMKIKEQLEGRKVRSRGNSVESGEKKENKNNERIP